MTPADAVAQALIALPPGQRQALLLSNAGMTFLEVADRLGEPVEKVGAAITQSLRALTQARLDARELGAH